MKKTSVIALLSVVLFSFIACKKDNKPEGEETPPPASTSGTVALKFQHRWEGTPFVASEMVDYINTQTNDTLAFTAFRYYITNIKLKRADGTFYVQPDSYYLVNVSETNPTPFTLNMGNIPTGTYTDIYYTFGVDSTRNVSGAQTGALDPANGMFWSWSTGYIMSKAEGISPNAQFGQFAFHLGGFHGANSVVIEKHLPLTPEGNLVVTASSSKKIHVDVAVEKMWQNSPSLSVVSDMQSPGATAKTMAIDFLSGMSLNFIE